MNDALLDGFQRLVWAIEAMSPDTYGLIVRFAYFLSLSLWVTMSVFEHQDPTHRSIALAWVALVPCYFAACLVPVIDPRQPSFKAFFFCICMAATLALPWRLAVFLAPKYQQIKCIRIGLYCFLLINYLATGG